MALFPHAWAIKPGPGDPDHFYQATVMQRAFFASQMPPAT
jgi:hypothetical protein